MSQVTKTASVQVRSSLPVDSETLRDALMGNFKDVTKSKILQVNLREVSEGVSYAAEDLHGFTWEVTSVEDTSFDIQLSFEESMAISNSQFFDYHAV